MDSKKLEKIWQAVKDNPNDMQLGRVIREMYWNIIDTNDYPYNTEFGSGRTHEEMEKIDQENNGRNS